ncbi:uncharacterized protein LOC113239095 isoform X2 [Hyposmocoma kahamanoa]|uniref:uncharacterized protein LOC113239095 isoform X2 n=1 Tax=Hyposmocoma kahamanoa TaxID=1477025 RepID=UPI000E6D72CB|nr:uncharacterized protein LOC113239095 isoform X2 [Hyposmocoma kahamanoa]
MYGDGFQRLKQKLEISNDSTKQSAGQYEERAYQTKTGDALSTGHTLVPRGGDDRHLSSDYTKSFVSDAQQHRKAEYTGHALTSIKATESPRRAANDTRLRLREVAALALAALREHSRVLALLLRAHSLRALPGALAYA